MYILQYGVSVNAVNNVGDTALHKAAHTGRLVGTLSLLIYFRLVSNTVRH